MKGEREKKGKCKIFSSEIRSLVKRELMIEMKIMVATLQKHSTSFNLLTIKHGAENFHTLSQMEEMLASTVLL